MLAPVHYNQTLLPHIKSKPTPASHTVSNRLRMIPLDANKKPCISFMLKSVRFKKDGRTPRKKDFSQALRNSPRYAGPLRVAWTVARTHTHYQTHSHNQKHSNAYVPKLISSWKCKAYQYTHICIHNVCK